MSKVISSEPGAFLGCFRKIASRIASIVICGSSRGIPLLCKVASTESVRSSVGRNGEERRHEHVRFIFVSLR